jgi:hypothetical protein
VNADELQQLLAARSGRPVELIITANRTRFVSFRPGDSGVQVRLQAAFLSAPGRALAALSRWIARGRGACPKLVREFVKAAAARLHAESPLPPAPLRAIRLRPAGRCHDLAPIYERVNREFFGGDIRAPITWGRLARLNRRVRCRRMGSFNHRRGLISINPVLDRPEVPEFFIEFIVYHEMLHAAQPAGTRRWHGREFHAAERRGPHYAAARAWEKKNLSVILQPK